jgi:tRNA A37 methylthiotransferase MiaB
MNKCDSEVLASLLSENGYFYIEDFQEADILLHAQSETPQNAKYWEGWKD